MHHTREESRQRYLGERGQKRIHFGVGLMFTWELKLRPNIICHKQQRNWIGTIQTRWNSAKAARQQFYRSRIPGNPPTDTAANVYAILEQDYYRELFHLYGGYTQGGINESSHIHNRLIVDDGSESADVR